MEQLTLDQIKELGEIAYKSGCYKLDNPAQGVIKILRGQELGFSPILSLEVINIIEGKTVMSAAAIAAKIKNSGKYDFRTVEKNAQGSVIKFFENGKEVGESKFGVEEAQKIGMDGWAVQKYPEDTFWARALTRGARTYCPDVFGGGVYTIGEIDKKNTEPKPETKTEAQPKLITSKQVNYLWAKAKEKGLNSVELFKIIEDNTGKKEMKDLTTVELNSILDIIKGM